MRTNRTVSACLLAIAALLTHGCDADTETGSCTANPWQCPAGQTCWVMDPTGAFACLNSAAGKNKGDACANTIGVPSCGDAMACLQTIAGGGFCAPYCDPTNVAHGCAAGETCRVVALTGTTTTFQVCVGSTAMDMTVPPNG